MSLILDALNKADKERQVPEIKQDYNFEPAEFIEKPNLHYQLIAAIVILLALMTAMLVFWFTRSESTQTHSINNEVQTQPQTSRFVNEKPVEQAMRYSNTTSQNGVSTRSNTREKQMNNMSKKNTLADAIVDESVLHENNVYKINAYKSNVYKSNAYKNNAHKNIVHKNNTYENNPYKNDTHEKAKADNTLANDTLENETVIKSLYANKEQKSQSIGELKETVKKSEVQKHSKPKPLQTKPYAQQKTTSIERTVPEIYSLPQQILNKIPSLNYDEHNFTERYIVINNQKLSEGQSLRTALRLEQVKPDSAIFKFEGHTFKLNAYSSWVNM